MAPCSTGYSAPQSTRYLALGLARCTYVPIGVPIGVLVGVVIGVLCLLSPRPAAAYPYMGLRPTFANLSGPTDSDLTALQFNPAALRLVSGIHVQVYADALGSLGSFTDAAQLPAGFSGAGSAAQAAPATPIRWVAPNTFAGASWDLGSDAVTIGIGFYTPFVETTHYGSGSGPNGSQLLPTRYSVISNQTYSLWGAAAVALRLTSWLYLGGGFNFAWTQAQIDMLRDPGSTYQSTDDGLPCGPGSTPCQQWSNRQELELNLNGWGYGFTAGLVVIPRENLWIAASYVSPLFTGGGAQISLTNFQDPSLGQAECVGSFQGARLTDYRPVSPGKPAPTNPVPTCGGADLILGYPHLIYAGLRQHRPLSSSGTWSPTAWEISSWVRLTIPPRLDEELHMEQRTFPLLPPLQEIAVEQQTAATIDLDFREFWPGLELGQGLIYQSPRTAAAAVSPANLDGHQIDVSLTARIRAGGNVWFRAGLGATFYVFGKNPGSGFNNSLATACRTSGYDVTTNACFLTQQGWALPPVAGSYSLAVLHGSAGLDLSFR